MPLRHGRDALRVETLQANEQTEGVPAPGGPETPFQAEGGRDTSGRLTANQRGSQVASLMGRKGGLARAAKARRLRVLTGLGLLGVTPQTLAPYAEAAFEFCEAEVDRLARECGGGVCPQNAAALVQQAALALAGSRAAYAAGDLAMGAKLGVEVRQNLLAARELTVLEAKARPRANQTQQRLEAMRASAPRPITKPKETDK